MELKDPSSVAFESEKFVFRFYGGNEGADLGDRTDGTGYGLELEMAVTQAASEMNIGPKVYLFEKEFRIENFVESRHFTVTDYADEEMLKEFARNLARFHSISERPEMQKFKGKDRDIFARAREHFANRKDRWADIFKLAKSDYGLTGDQDENVLLEKINSLEKISKELKLKKVMINNDLNLSNILIRNVTKPGQLKTVLVDYEFAHYAWRSFDLGFLPSANGMTAFRNKGQHILSEEEVNGVLDYYENTFIRTYFQEYLEFNKGKTDETLDTWSNFWLEVKFGICLTHYYITLLRCYFYFQACPDEDNGPFARRMQSDLLFGECAEKRLNAIRNQ